MASKGKIWIGTSGWVYKSWHRILYPPEVKKDFLSHYSRHFNSVEVNTSFYHLPKETTFAKWRDEVPDDFVFSVKFSRYITHIEKLRRVKTAIRRFFSNAKKMKPKLSVVLVQLPPSLKYEKKLISVFAKNLNDVLKQLKFRPRIALEPRNKSWFEDKNTDEIKSLLKKNKIGLVFAHSSVFPKYDPIPENVITKFVYIRFHGPKEFAASKYGRKMLSPWAKLILGWQAKGIDVYAYFNDDAHGYAVSDAKMLMELTSGML